MTLEHTPTKEDVKKSFERKQAFFDSGATRSYDFRMTQLQAMRDSIKKHEAEILGALHADMRKPPLEALISELQFLYDEIDHTMAHLKGWMQPDEVATPDALQPATSSVKYDPLGVVLVIGPWNYPFQLLMAPVIASIAAGNCTMVKPSNQTAHTAAIIGKVIEEAFDENYISVVQGPGSQIGPLIIENNRFDHIFFTGSPGVGKQIASMAARHLTPVTLELGGKSPVIFDKDVNIGVAARRLTWGKFFNAGQTCVCPDYVLAHADIKDALIAEVRKNITNFFGDDPKASPDFARIVNERRVGALKALLKGDIVVGGDVDEAERYVAPTVIDNVSMDDPIMQEEIFGPIMPILTWTDRADALSMIRKNRHPLALYVFSEDQETVDYFLDNVESGGACVNNTMLHLTNPDLPFGGVGNSGMGQYHGHHSFLTMSHQRAVLNSATTAERKELYAPYPDLAALAG